MPKMVSDIHLPDKCPVCGGTDTVKFDVGPGAKPGPGFYSAIMLMWVDGTRYEIVVCAKDGTQYLRKWKKPTEGGD
jgi:hypothetical protein